VVPKVYPVDPKGFAISSHRVLGYISAMADLKFTFSLIKGVVLFLNNHGTSLICMTVRIFN